jgi:hypothetical protein
MHFEGFSRVAHVADHSTISLTALVLVRAGGSEPLWLAGTRLSASFLCSLTSRLQIFSKSFPRCSGRRSDDPQFDRLVSEFTETLSKLGESERSHLRGMTRATKARHQ